MADIGLTAAELTAIRDDVEDLLPDTCTLQILTQTVNDIGEPVKSYDTNRGTAIKCRLDPIPEIGWEVLGGFMDVVKYTGKFLLTLMHNQTITLDDRAIINGEIYEVDHIDQDKSYRASVKCVVEKVRP